MEKDPVRKFLEGIEESEHDFVQKTPFQEQAEPEKADEEAIEVPQKEQRIDFHKDPKVQKFIEKEISKRMEQYVPQKQEERKPLVDEEYYIRLIGNDTPEKLAMIKESMSRDERLLELAEQRAFERLSAKEQESLMAERQAEEELESAFDSIEDTFGVDISSSNPLARKARNEFISYVEKIAPKDRNGDIREYPDMLSAWETFSELRQRQPSRSKELASRSMGRQSEASQQPTQKVGWDETERYIESLG